MRLALYTLVSALPVMAEGAAAENLVPGEQISPQSELTDSAIIQAPALVTEPEPAPSVEPTPAPAAEPEPAPAEEPAPAPAAEPEPAPAVEPTPAPAAEPEPAPAEEPTPAPAAEPEPAPAVEPTPAPAAEPEPAPAVEPTPAPATEPELAPAVEPSVTTKASADITAAYRGIVKVEVVNRTPDYETPWQGGAFGQGTGTGFLVAPGLFMTNAHVVANAEKIDISLFADARRIPAKVKFVAHDADLALLEIENTAAFDGVPCLEFSEEMPMLEDTVRAIGYPIGGNRLSVTRGIVSRIDTISYAHPRNIAHLALQVDAAINPGNSGGPVLKGNKVIGVAFQGLLKANSTGYVIPMPVIQHFMKDVEDGSYDGYVEMGAQFLPMENKAMRRHYGLEDNGIGCLVADLVKGGSCDGALKLGDVVMAVNGLPVDASAMIELEGVRVRLEELAERSFAGEKVQFTILREGEIMQTEAVLAPLPSIRVLSRRYDEQPRYVVFGGLVFQPLDFNTVQEHQIPSGDVMVEMDRFTRGGESKEKDDIVLLTRILPDEVNARFGDKGRSVVTKVNGVPIKGLSHLHSLLYPEEGVSRPEYTVIELADAPRPLIIDNTAVDAANDRISERYNVQVPSRL